jgi:hypothetical protein
MIEELGATNGPNDETSNMIFDVSELSIQGEQQEWRMKIRISTRFWGIIFSACLSLFIFVLFTFSDILTTYNKFIIGTLTTQEVNKILVSGLQSTVVFLVGSFLSIFLARFQNIEQGIIDTANNLQDNLPLILQEKIQKSVAEISTELVKLRKNLAEGMVRTGAHTYRALRYDENTGVLFNHTSNDPDAPRNVLFNNKTIAILLDTAKAMNADLEAIGYECGVGFGPFLNNYLQMSLNKEVNLKGIIALWIEYDSNAGFGKFECQSTETEQLESIRLRHGFLTAVLSFQNANKSLCNFMTGYLNGVLSTLPGDIIRDAGYKTGRLVVSHDVTSEYCVCTNKNQLLGCTWKVTEYSS